MKNKICFLAITLWMSFSVTSSHAAELTTLTPFGSSDNRVDIIFVSEGYTASEESEFDQHVEDVIDTIFSRQPFSSYITHFKHHSIFEPSNESGSDHSSPTVMRDTAFGSYYDCNGITQLICFDVNAVNSVVNSVADATQRDLIILLVNDPQPGGSGGSIAAVSTEASSIQINTVHELAHTFGGLADEYETPYPQLNPCNGGVFEPSEPNVTSSLVSLPANTQMIKWNDPSPGQRISPWFNQYSQSHLPTTNVTPNQPGLYEGAHHCYQNFFRPTYNSAMRSPSMFSLDVVNEEILTRRIHDFVSPINSASPTNTTIQLSQSSFEIFSVDTISGEGGTSVIEWKLNNTIVGDQAVQQVDAFFLPSGNYTLTVSVTETTDFVRRDLLEQMTAIHEWQITIN